MARTRQSRPDSSFQVKVPNAVQHVPPSLGSGPVAEVGLLFEQRDNRLRARRATRPHTVGYTGGGDQEQGDIKSPGRPVGQIPLKDAAARVRYSSQSKNNRLAEMWSGSEEGS